MHACMHARMHRWRENETVGDEVGLVTMTGKLKRASIKNVYRPSVNAKYAEIADPKSVPSTESTPASEDRGTAVPGDSSEVPWVFERLLQYYESEVKNTKYSRAQIENKGSVGLFEYRKGSRECELSFKDSTGTVKTVNTARGRDWLVGCEAFLFNKVRDIGHSGKELGPDEPTVEVSGLTDITVQLRRPGEAEMMPLQANSLEAVRDFRQHVCTALEHRPRCMQLVLNGKLLENDSETLDGIGIGDGTVVSAVAQYPKADEASHYSLALADAKALNDSLADVRNVALTIRANLAHWTDDYKRERSFALQCLEHAIKTMDQHVATMARSHAKTWGMQMALASGSHIANLVDTPSLGIQEPSDRSALQGVTDQISRTKTADEWLIDATGDRPSENTAPLMRSLQAVLSALTRGHLSVLHHQEKLGRVQYPAEHVKATDRLNKTIEALR